MALGVEISGPAEQEYKIATAGLEAGMTNPVPKSQTLA
jgi:hypothetical protein